jgi:hypothetical protein
VVKDPTLRPLGIIAPDVPSPYGTPSEPDPYHGTATLWKIREEWVEWVCDSIEPEGLFKSFTGGESRVVRINTDTIKVFSIGTFNMDRRKKQKDVIMMVMVWEVLGGKIQITHQGDRDFAERHFTQGFLDNHCQLVGPRLQEGWRQFADDEIPKKKTDKKRDAHNVDQMLNDNGRLHLDTLLDLMNLDKYQEFTQGLTFALVCDMSVAEIMACLRMPHDHAILLYQEVQKYEDVVVRRLAPRPPQSTPDRQTHVAKGTVTPQPEDVMLLVPSTKDKETVIWNKRTSDGKRTPLCVVRDHDIRNRWPQRMSADDRKERHQYFKDRYDKAMLDTALDRAASDEREARKRKRAEDRGGSGAGGGSASGGAPKTKRG